MLVRSVAIILLLLGLQPAQLDQQWGEVIRNERLAVEIERVLYEQKEDPRFFIHVRIRNRSSETLELDLRDRWNVVYPNQMADIDTERRGIVDDMMRFSPLDEASRKELIDSYGSATLKSISPGGFIDYFVDFNSPGGRQTVDKATHKFIVLSIRGQLFATNGVLVWTTMSADPGFAPTDFAIPRPVTWKSIPAGATVVVQL